MGQLDLTTLSAILGDEVVELPDESHTRPASGLATHTGRLRPGDAFVALSGEHTHGIVHADAALGAGAPFLISDRPHPRALRVRDSTVALMRLGRHARDQHRGPVVAITGSVGKTTTKTLLGAALAARTSPGNINTPAALACVLIDAWLHDPAERSLVVELGIDRPGEMALLLSLVRPSHGVLTTVSEAHLAGLGSLATIAREKSLILEAAASGRYAGEGAWPHLAEHQRAVTTLVSLGAGTPGGSFDARARRLDARLRSPTGDPLEVAVSLPGLGAPVAHAALLALQVALDLGVSVDLAARRVSSAELEARRLQLRELGALVLLDDTYNANPTSMHAALEVLLQLPGPHAAVLGDMRELGERSISAHQELGRTVSQSGVTEVWFVGNESLAAFEAASALPRRHHLWHVEALINKSDELPDRGSLLVKGSRSLCLERLVDALVDRSATAVAP